MRIKTIKIKTFSQLFSSHKNYLLCKLIHIRINVKLCARDVCEVFRSVFEHCIIHSSYDRKMHKVPTIVNSK